MVNLLAFFTETAWTELRISRVPDLYICGYLHVATYSYIQSRITKIAVISSSHQPDTEWFESRVDADYIEFQELDRRHAFIVNIVLLRIR